MSRPAPETPIPAPAPDATRVSLRRRRPSGALMDVVGHLVAANDEWLVVLPEDRGPEWVPRGEVQAVRRVPERVALPASPPAALQRVLDLAWPGLRRARLGGWVVRVGRGATRRANSVLAVGDPGLPFRQAVAAAEDWAGVPLPLQAVLGSAVAEEARALGWTVSSPTLVLVASAPSGGHGPQEDLVVADAPDEAWLRVFHGGEADEARVSELLAAPARYLRVGDAAVGRVAVVRSWGVLSCVEVAPGMREQGLGRTMTRALAAEALRLGARYLALQVEEDNAAALGLYAAEGYTEHHRYGYLRSPDAPGG
ncbi:MAG TPA: GNAT family N-acetyltransferase [Arachnia sp.]|nr:GNAT family N-acetyltransferase [Arachnia sp.]HMT86686.1 GNAT family N-acetyltransferase [Arachnia sp.]